MKDGSGYYISSLKLEGPLRLVPRIEYVANAQWCAVEALAGWPPGLVALVRLGPSPSAVYMQIT